MLHGCSDLGMQTMAMRLGLEETAQKETTCVWHAQTEIGWTFYPPHICKYQSALESIRLFTVHMSRTYATNQIDRFRVHQADRQ